MFSDYDCNRFLPRGGSGMIVDDEPTTGLGRSLDRLCDRIVTELHRGNITREQAVSLVDTIADLGAKSPK